ncbi:MAG: hypothetical protein J6Y75_01900 [Spirochaetaceae bacterium]|nr:hypothetical protein [Spirochaetaceae bacterium]
MISGFPSPAQGYESSTIDLNAVLIKHPAATVFMQIESSRYRNMGIYDGDLLVIDRALPFNPKALVVYESEGHFALGRACNIGDEMLITGTITYIIHTVKRT